MTYSIYEKTNKEIAGAFRAEVINARAIKAELDKLPLRELALIYVSLGQSPETLRKFLTDSIMQRASELDPFDIKELAGDLYKKDKQLADLQRELNQIRYDLLDLEQYSDHEEDPRYERLNELYDQVQEEINKLEKGQTNNEIKN
jgi:hypothetical protein